MQRKHEEMIQSNPAIMMGKPVMAGTRDQEIVFRQKRTSCGVLLLRLAEQFFNRLTNECQNPIFNTA